MGATRRCFALILLSLLFVNSTRPWPSPALSLDKLTADASLVAVGQITLVQEVEKTSIHLADRTFTARAMVAELHVDEVLKGNSEGTPSSLRFHFVVPDEFIGWRSITPLSYRVFFLTESSGELKIADPYFPSVIALPGTETRPGTAIERVIGQLSAVLESAKAPFQDRQEAVFTLRSSTNPAAVQALRRVVTVQDVTLRLSVAAALLEHNDISTLPFSEDSLLNPDPRVPVYLLRNLSYAISEGIKDERAVPALTRLLHAADAETRRAAASALMHIGSSSCIDPLLSAIGDSDRDVQYYSVVGLAEITGQTEWRPNMDDFMADQKKYINHWREWSRTR